MENSKKALGYYLRILTLIVTIIGLISYFVNTNTTYFRNLGINNQVVILVVFTILVSTLILLVGKINIPKIVLDLLPILIGICLAFATVTLISGRINSMAAIITFNNNAQNMSDMMSAVVGIGCLALAVLLNIVTSFFEVTKK